MSKHILRKHHRSMGSNPALAAALRLDFGATQAAAQETYTASDVRQKIGSAKTAEDRKAIAVYYQAEAEKARGRTAEHGEAEEAYLEADFGTAATKNLWAPGTIEHCNDFVNTYKAVADFLNKLAREHERSNNKRCEGERNDIVSLRLLPIVCGLPEAKFSLRPQVGPRLRRVLSPESPVQASPSARGEAGAKRNQDSYLYHREGTAMKLQMRICSFLIFFAAGGIALLAQENSFELLTMSQPVPGNRGVEAFVGNGPTGSFEAPRSAGEGVVSIAELVAEAVERNPEILAARRKFDAASKRPSQLSTLPEPKFSYTNFGVGQPFSTLNVSDFAYQGVGVSQEIPFPGKLALKSDMARKEAESERQMVLDTELRVISRLKQAYYDLFYIHKAIEIVSKNRDLVEKFTKIAEAKYRVGTGIQQDVLKAQVEISRLAQRLEVLDQQRGSLEAYLNSLLDRSTTATFGKPSALKKSELTYDLEQLIRLARESAPRLRSRQSLLDGNAFALNLARKDYLPDFGFAFQYQKTGSLFPDYYMATAEVRVPLYFWRKQRLGVEEAATKLVQSRHEYQALGQEIFFGIKDQFLVAKTAGRLLDLYEQGIIPQAATSLESAVAGYQVGKVDFLTLISNLMSLLSFEMEYYRELSSHEKALAKLEELVGVRLQ